MARRALPVALVAFCVPGVVGAQPRTADEEPVAEAVVRGQRPRRELTVVPVSREEVQRIPGSFGDALRSIQNLPGVARAPFLSGSLIVRGSAPADTLVLVDGTFLPAAYHFGGLGSTIATEMLDRLDFYPGNFSARFGRATGGVVDVGLRPPLREGARASVHLGVIEAGAFVEAALSSTVSIASSARFGWLGYFASPIVAAVTGTAAFFGYWDYQTQADWRPTGRDRLRVAVYGSGDSVGVQTRNGGSNGVGLGYHLVQLSWSRRFDARTDLSVALSTGWNGLAVTDRPSAMSTRPENRVALDSVPTHVRVAATRAEQGMAVDTWCQTPCALYLRPGEHVVWTGAPSVMDAVTRVRVGEAALTLRVRAPLRSDWQRGRNVLVGGVGLASVAGIFLAFSPLEVTGGSPTGPETIAVGAAVGAIGAALIVYGLRVMGAQRPGAEITRAE